MKKQHQIQQCPVFLYRNLIISSINKFKFLFISSETGSGKTTIIPQIIYNTGKFPKIIISQTRRISAISAAKYVSKIFGCKIGQQVGYSVRFEDNSSPQTMIKFVTDGIFFKETFQKNFFSKYSCVIIDEFHERTVYTDFLLSIIKNSQKYKKNSKILIMSASGNSKKVADYFGIKVGKIFLPGKIFDVSVFYLHSPQTNFICYTSSTILKVHLSQKIPGDILVFLPGLEEIEEVFGQIFSILKKKENFLITKLYAKLTLHEQKKNFEAAPQGLRKIILSTNIAESSVTIPGITFVIDCGLSKQKIVNWKTSIDVFKIYPISKSEAHQRTGRAGRTGSGKCFRLFTFFDFKLFSKFPKPEIQRTDLTGIILQLSSFKLKNLFNLDFINLPSQWGVIRSLETLFILGAIDRHLQLTFIGKCISLFPLEVELSKSIIEALRIGEKNLILWVIATSSLFSINFSSFFRLSKYKGFKNFQNMGDHFLLAKIYFDFQIQNKMGKGINWCKKKKINQNLMKIASDIYQQLLLLCQILRLYFKRIYQTSKKKINFFLKFKFCFVGGYFLNSARLIGNSKKFQNIITGIISNIHPCSIINYNYPKILIFRDIFLTYEVFMRDILPIRLIWVLLLGYKIYK